jgi:hypothetical protein
MRTASNILVALLDPMDLRQRPVRRFRIRAVQLDLLTEPCYGLPEIFCTNPSLNSAQQADEAG